jgi:hypothetical protein
VNACRCLLILLFAGALCTASEKVASPPPGKVTGWSALRVQLSVQEAAAIMVEAVGNPVIIHRGRNGLFEQWFYDRGGWLFFQRGRLVFWRASECGSNDRTER